LAEANRGLDASARVRLRVALHRGLVQPASNGWIGSAAIAVHRFLGAGPVRAALHEQPEADFVLAVPDLLFRDVIAHSYESLRPEAFRRITVDLPEKGFIEHGWVYLAPSPQ